MKIVSKPGGVLNLVDQRGATIGRVIDEDQAAQLDALNARPVAQRPKLSVVKISAESLDEQFSKR